LIRNITSLGEKEARLLIALRTAGKSIFTFADAKKVLSSSSERSIAQMLYALTKKRWLRRLEKGKYLILPFEAGEQRTYTAHEFIIAANLITPCYIGFRSALNYYGLTEQVSKTVYVVTDRQKKSLTVDTMTFKFVKLPQRKLFGTTKITIQEEKINISDKEKTIIDCLDHLEYAGGITEVAKGLWLAKDELDFGKLISYALRIEEKALIQRLGLLLEYFKLVDEELLASLCQRIGRGYVKLDTLSINQGRYLSKWYLRVNVPETVLTEWREH